MHAAPRDYRVLVVEDDPAHALLMEETLRGIATAVRTVKSRRDAVVQVESQRFDAMLIDVSLPDGNGFDLHEHVRTLPEQPAVVFVTSDDLAEHAVDALRAGAADYIVKRPRYLERLRSTVSELAGRACEPSPALGVREDDPLLGSSLAMERVRARIRQYGPLAATVLIAGETGTGKEVVARQLHAASPRAGRAFVAVNCAAVTASLFESELFGSVRGAFTGSAGDRDGLVRSADGGTLFLDEVGELPRELQAKLLRFLEDGSYRPVGASSERTSNARVIAATNRDLAEAVDRSEFRRDLYFRLNVLRIAVPPLRERPEDVALLVDRFLRLEGASARRCSVPALDELRAWAWPGNVRELRHVVQRTLAHVPSGEIARFDLDRGAAEPCAVEVQDLRTALLRHDGRLEAVARALGVSIRTVQRRMKVGGLSLAAFRVRTGRGRPAD